MTAPGVLFIAEAIVAPVEVIKYFGEDAIIAKECEIAYNATLMALLWDGIATKNTKLLYQGVKNMPAKLERATWLNYVRCHDDIGFGFDDNDVRAAGYEPFAHRQFLVDYFSGQFDASLARGMVFIRFNHQRPSERVLVIANFDANPQYFDLEVISGRGINLLVILSTYTALEHPPSMIVGSFYSLINFIG